MDVDCEGCAGCCIDWRPLTDRAIDRWSGAGDRRSRAKWPGGRRRRTPDARVV